MVEYDRSMTQENDSGAWNCRCGINSDHAYVILSNSSTTDTEHTSQRKGRRAIQHLRRVHPCLPMAMKLCPPLPVYTIILVTVLTTALLTIPVLIAVLTTALISTALTQHCTDHCTNHRTHQPYSSAYPSYTGNV
jgi:hypothetical protein